MIKTANAIRRMVLPLIVAGLGVLPCTMAARADDIFDFSGTCAFDCSGAATGVLDLTNAYVFGSNITAADFVSLSYTSSDLNFTIPASSSPFLAGGLDADGAIATGGVIIAANSIFAAIPGVFFAHNGGGSTDIGTSFTFTPASAGTNPAPDPTPLPAALPLLATGLGALGLLGWRRKRKSRISLLGAA
jgi:hypothetical protein